ncbi:MAG: hypothetical protein UX02_C0006G0026 [Candidatus Moranbacteria bacterium GW2011_GWC1_45_18]|nr:MAG: hypothetical protein UT79_C0001G0026 [Candidatus Moranbacteria bacterium GW2011_GWC2_40_12]KKT32758.1 MAG: hypothetical protein UW19_C0016G0025 [Candidatus Moranbacteria bacterium GW2011_GWF2_44_10]KKT99147.1 MAG: hypothetical protein UX02_C0006G0026 [Candidatus Moranbacteria bacterium GW2011_GWC1_45_18]HBB37523.1 hypothetical protein [Candidatus Moranbacteria bacterium]HBU24645.1 hypothetical protein [Candidatus Moranbacteria bacterium]
MMQNVQVLKITRTKEIIFSAVFTALAIYAPMVVHHFAGVDGGRKFLPMPFFVLLAGLTLGWRAGIAAGLASPVISFLLSGMPMLNILPIIIIQLSAYGFLAGILKEKFNGFIAPAGAIVLGLILTGFAVFLFSEMNAAAYVINAVRDGWVGIALQLLILPIIIKFSRDYLFD